MTRHLLAVAIGGATGAVARYGITRWVSHGLKGDFPWGTLAVILIGSYLIGFLVGIGEVVVFPASMRAFLVLGLLGAFTTFSTFSAETLYLLRTGEVLHAIGNVAIHNGAGILLVFAGYVSGSAGGRYLTAA